MRLVAVFFLALAMTLAGCTDKKGTPHSAPENKGPVILSTTVAPGSAFKMAASFDPPQPLMSRKTNFRLTLTDLSGAPVSDAKAQAALVMPLMDMGKNEFALQPAGNGVYTGTGQFTMSGEWEVVFSAAAGGKNGKTTFNVRVED